MIDIEGAVCPNCGERKVVHIGQGRVQCRSCLRSMEREIIFKGDSIGAHHKT